MDSKTLSKLEFDKIKDQLSELTGSDGGRDMVVNMMPSAEIGLVTVLMDQTEEAMEALRYAEPEFLNGLKVITNQLAKARVGGIISPADLRDIYKILRAARLINKYLASGKYSRLREVSSNLAEKPNLEKKIDMAISDEGEVRDDASPELKNIRNGINTMRLRIRTYLQDFIRSENNQKKLQDALVTERDGRYVVPVKQEFRYEVKGIIHDESASGATVFIEPLPVVEQNNRIRAYQAEEKREIERILRALSSEIALYIDELSHNAEILSQIDFIFARARLAYKMNAFRPEINRNGIIDIRRAKHPLLGEKAVPVNVQLGQKFDVLVVTGPNTGGKTVVLKTIGLLTLMVMSGLFIPARERSKVAIFSSVFMDIGDEQSIEQSLSTFSSHMSNIIDILGRAGNDSLVLLDELGAGTDPVEGSALARVILEKLLAQKARVVVTTHQSELKTFAYLNERVENACVEFDPVSLRPTYDLTIGMPGQSNAFVIASRLGLSPSLVKRAQELVPKDQIEMGNMISKLKETRYEYEKSNLEINQLRDKLTAEKQTLQEERQRFYEERNEAMDKAHQEADQYIRQIKREAGEAIQELKEILKNKEQPPKWHEVEQKHHKIKRLGENQLNHLAGPSGQSAGIKAGDYVFIKDIKQKGHVITGPDAQGEVVVQVGVIKLNVKQQQLNPCDAPEEKVAYYRNQSYLEKAKTISKELDLRGKMAAEALYEVERYLEDANLVGLESVRIIHGKGTGALRKAVQSYLKDHRYVKNYRDGLHDEGGFGVTVVEFRS